MPPMFGPLLALHGCSGSVLRLNGEPATMLFNEASPSPPMSLTAAEGKLNLSGIFIANDVLNQEGMSCCQQVNL